MVFEKTVGQVVDENYVYARALHYLGIDFFVEPDRKLKEICAERGLDRKTVIKCFYAFDSSLRVSFSEIEKYPIELLLEYLKHSHYVFIKEKLPFIVHLVDKWNGEPGIRQLIPEFVEDFIKHIYEEEDSTFKYIESLSRTKQGSVQDSWVLLTNYQDYSLKAEFAEHQDDDEFGAIRSLLSSIDPVNLHDQVLLHEIKAFDREMIYHAEIENNILFPKAIQLEEDAFKKMQIVATQN